MLLTEIGSEVEQTGSRERMIGLIWSRLTLNIDGMQIYYM